MTNTDDLSGSWSAERNRRESGAMYRMATRMTDRLRSLLVRSLTVMSLAQVVIIVAAFVLRIPEGAIPSIVFLVSNMWFAVYLVRRGPHPWRWYRHPHND